MRSMPNVFSKQAQTHDLSALVVLTAGLGSKRLRALISNFLMFG